MDETALRNEEFPDIGGRKIPVEIEEFEHEILKKFRIALKDMDKLNCPMNEFFLIRFLRAKKYNVEAAVKTVDKYFYVRIQNLELTTISYDTFGKVFDTKMALIFKNRDEYGRQIICFRVKKWDPHVLSYDEITTALYLVLEEVTTLTETQKQGIICIIDAADLTLSHAKAVAKECSLRQLKMLITVLQGAFPVKVKGIFGINMPHLFTAVYAVIKYFIRSKLRNRIHFSSSGPEVLNSYLNENIRPDFLGGNLTCEDAEDTNFFTAIIENKSYYKALEKFGYSS